MLYGNWKQGELAGSAQEISSILTGRAEGAEKQWALNKAYKEKPKTVQSKHKIKHGCDFLLAGSTIIFNMVSNKSALVGSFLMAV